MAIVDIEIRQGTFEALAGFILSSAPRVPVPTLPLLGDERLISAFRWGPATLGAGPVGHVRPPGAVLAQAPLIIFHVSLAELRASPTAPGVGTACIAHLQLRTDKATMLVELIAVAIGNAPPITLAPLQINQFALGSDLGAAFASTAAFVDSGIVTLRFATRGGDNLQAAPRNRLAAQSGSNWLIGISGDSFVEQLLDSVGSALSPPPAGLRIEDPLGGGWTFDSGNWFASAGIGLEQTDACPGIFSDTDVSVDMRLRLLLLPDVDNGLLKLRLEVNADASDWDSFRCWLGGGLLIGLAAGGLINPALGFIAGIGSLIGIGMIIETATGKAVQDFKAGKFQKVEGDDASAAFESMQRLPQLPGSTGLSATVDADGLTVTGTILALSVDHKITLAPPDGRLSGAWGGAYSCSLRAWGWQFQVPPIVLQDETQLLGKRITRLPVRVFQTSVAEPASAWALSLPFTPSVIQTVGVTSRGDVSGQQALVVIHSSVGVSVFSVPPIAERPTKVPRGIVSAMEKYCNTFVEIDRRVSRLELKWVEPPPIYVHGQPALRQWQIVIGSISAPGALRLTPSVAGRSADEVAYEWATDAQSPVSINIVADGTQDFIVTHSVPGASFGIRALQRWLLPLMRFQLDRPATRLRRVGDQIEITMGDRQVMLSTRDWALSDPPMPAAVRQVGGASAAPTGAPLSARYAGPRHDRGAAPFFDIALRSITLRGGLVVAAHRDQVIVASTYSSVRDRGHRHGCACAK